MTGLGLGVISIVDDDESIRAATKGLLISGGYEVEAFASADLFLASGALRVMECLILDIRMPGIDGLELQRRLNAEECHVPVIFVTAHDDTSNRRKALDAGALAVFCKPFDAHELMAAIEAALRRPRGAVDMTRDSRRGLMFEGPPERKILILVVDDNPADVHLLRLALIDAQLDCELTVIDDGAEALAFARQEGNYEGSAIPELVVLDLNLPKRDGLEVLEAIRKNRALSDVPVAVLSSGLSPQQLTTMEGFNLAYRSTKPSTLEEFSKIGLDLKALVEMGSCRRSSQALA